MRAASLKHEALTDAAAARIAARALPEPKRMLRAPLHGRRCSEPARDCACGPETNTKQRLDLGAHQNFPRFTTDPNHRHWETHHAY
jgi:hypothetical protein